MRTGMAVLSSAVFTVISGVALYFVVDWTVFFSTITAVQPLPLMLGVGLTAVVYVLRTMRLSRAITPQGGLSLYLLRLVSLQSLANHLLPAKLGEAALVLMLRTWHAVPVTTGTGILLLVRGFDLLIVVGLGAVAAAAVLASQVADARLYGLSVGALWAVAGAVWLGPFLFYALRPIRWLHHLERGREDSRWGRIGRLVAAVLRPLFALPPRQLVVFWGLTLALWIAQMLAAYVVTLSVAPGFPFAVAVAGMAAGSIAFALPIGGLASFGPFEAAWTLTAVALGADGSAALAGAVTVHLASIGVAAASSALLFPVKGGVGAAS